MDVKQVARELGVQYVLEGSVRSIGARLRITAQLIDASAGQHVWAERYDRQVTDIFDVRDEVNQSIVGTIATEFLSFEAKRARRKDPAKLDAWECVMRGRAHLWKLSGEEAIATAQRAMGLAPQNPTFRRQLASALAWGGRMDEARVAVRAYLELEPEHTTADAGKVPSSVPEHVARFVEGLRRAGLPDEE